MAQKICRIDAVNTLPDGQVVVEFTVGSGPLGPPGGRQLIYPNKQALFAALEALEAEISDEMLALMAIAQWNKVDQQFSNTTLARNKSASLDLTGNGNVIRIA